MPSNFNSTMLNSTNIINTLIKNESFKEYDYEGAAIYVAVILIWYSTGLALMLFLQVRPRTFDSQFLLDYQLNDKSKSCSLHAFGNYHNVEADHMKRHILNELKDPDRRQRLWKIYYSSKEEQNEPHPRYYQTITADSATIGHINRKLADIHRIDARNRDDTILPLFDISTNSNKFETSKCINKRITSCNRSNGVSFTNNRETLGSIPSQPDAEKIAAQLEVKPIVCDKSCPPSLTNGSRKRLNKLSNRFIIEKVSENNKNNSDSRETE